MMLRAENDTETSAFSGCQLQPPQAADVAGFQPDQHRRAVAVTECLLGGPEQIRSPSRAYDQHPGEPYSRRCQSRSVGNVRWRDP